MKGYCPRCLEIECNYPRLGSSLGRSSMDTTPQSEEHELDKESSHLVASRKEMEKEAVAMFNSRMAQEIPRWMKPLSEGDKFERVEPRACRYFNELLDERPFDKYQSEESLVANYLKFRHDPMCMQWDVVIEAECCHFLKKIYAQRNILSARSSVFRKVFESPLMQRPGTGVIIIYGASQAAIEAVVHFCYTGKISFREDLSCNGESSSDVTPDMVFKVAHKLELHNLGEVCEIELCKRLCVGNLTYMLMFSGTFTLGKLRRAAMKFLEGHFDQVEDQVYQLFQQRDFDPSAGISVQPTPFRF